MQTHTFSIKQALLFPFQMLVKRPLLFFMMLAIAIVIPYFYDILMSQLKTHVLNCCTSKEAVADMLTKLLPVFVLLKIITTSMVNCLLTAISISFYRTGTAPFKTIVTSLKYIPLYAILTLAFNQLPTYAVYSATVYIIHLYRVLIPTIIIPYCMLIVAIIMTAALSRFALYPFFLIDKKAGIRSAITSFQATRHNYLKITALAFAFFGVQVMEQLSNTKLAVLLSRFFSAHGFNPLTIILMIPVMMIAHVAIVYSTCGLAYAYGKLSE